MRVPTSKRPNACGGAGPKESYYNDDPPNKLLDSR
jgi:hypothetical protein